jgi:hypothetical protein
MFVRREANNGGELSVRRYCGETIFPNLDYLVDLSVQIVLVKNVQGEARSSRRRHLLSSGWGRFVNQKKLEETIVLLPKGARQRDDCRCSCALSV